MDQSLALVGIVVDFTPVGDIVATVDCGLELSSEACLGLLVGLVPMLGDGAKIFIKRVDGPDILAEPDGTGGLRMLRHPASTPSMATRSS